MSSQHGRVEAEQYVLRDDGTFPNSRLPVLVYRRALKLPPVFAAAYVRRLFAVNGWSNAWNYGIFEYHHYHSITHEVLGVHKGGTTLQLGGREGVKIKVERGDVIIIPAGVAHKNLGKETQLKCVGAYPGGSAYDINYGHAGERPAADRNIRRVQLPSHDPVFGKRGGLKRYW